MSSTGMMTAEAILETIQKESERRTEERFARTMQTGEWVRQGDVYIVRLNDDAKTSDTPHVRQLAPGTSKGSRHVVAGKAKVYAPLGEDPLVGPTIVAKARFVVEHPEHAHVSLPAGRYGVRYQQDIAREERARVLD